MVSVNASSAVDRKVKPGLNKVRQRGWIYTNFEEKKILFAFKGYTCRFKSEAFASFASIALRPWVGQIKDCKIGISSHSAKLAALRSDNKDW